MAKEKRKIIFRRIRGRLVPIRVKEGSGKRGGRLKAAANPKQKVGKGLVIGGSVLTSLGLLLRTKTIFKSKGLNEFRRLQVIGLKGKEKALETLIRKRGVVSLKNMQLLSKARKARIKETGLLLKAKPLKFTGRSLIIPGLVAMGLGIFSARRGNKQRSKESRALNK